jgi:hypothetical protein
MQFIQTYITSHFTGAYFFPLFVLTPAIFFSGFAPGGREILDSRMPRDMSRARARVWLGLEVDEHVVSSFHGASDSFAQDGDLGGAGGRSVGMQDRGTLQFCTDGHKNLAY